MRHLSPVRRCISEMLENRLLFAVQAEFFVSPTAASGGDGSLAQPFNTILQAQNKVKTVNGAQTGDIVVNLMGGLYTLPSTINMTTADSGMNGYRIIWQSYQDADVRISMARPVTSAWTLWDPAKNIYRTLAPINSFRDLYVNNERAIRARDPNPNPYADAPDFVDYGFYGGFNRFRNANGAGPGTFTGLQDLNANEYSTSYTDPTEIEAFMMRDWDGARMRVASATPAADAYNHVRVQYQSYESINIQKDSPSRVWLNAYFTENAYQMLDTPGEWYLDRNATSAGPGSVGTEAYLYYIPRANENMATVDVQAPRSSPWLNITDTKNVTFSGLTFEASGVTLADNKPYVGIQGGMVYGPNNGSYVLDSAIALTNAQNITFTGNVFRHTGAGAIATRRNTLGTTITGNLFYDIGANPISLNDSRDSSNPTVGEVVSNNYITGFGQAFPSGTGIFASYTNNTTISNNTVWDGPNYGISIGWGLTASDTSVHHINVMNNEVFNVNRIASDGGAIYTQSKQPGSQIVGNYVHDVVASLFSAGSKTYGIFLDHNSSQFTIANNVITNIYDKNGAALPAIYAAADATPNTYSNNDTQDPTIIAGAGVRSASTRFAGRVYFSKATAVAPVNLALTPQFAGQQIRYTTDGSEPTATSPLYSSGLAIISGTRVRARAFASGLLPGLVSESIVADAASAVALQQDTLPGLSYRFFTGASAGGLPNYDSMTPSQTGVLADVNTSPMAALPATGGWGMVAEGLITVPNDNLYSFYMKFPTAGRLIVDGKVIIDRPNYYRTPAFSTSQSNIPPEWVATTALKAGRHAIRIELANNDNGQWDTWFKWAENSASVRTKSPVAPGTLTHLVQRANQQVINVDLDDKFITPQKTFTGQGAYASQNAEYWNGLSRSGSFQLKDSTNVTTPVYADIRAIGGGSGAGAVNDLMNDFYWADASGIPTFTLNGLDTSKRYDLYFYSQDASIDGRGANFTINGVSQRPTGNRLAKAYVEGENYVVFRNLSPSNTGVINGTYNSLPGKKGVFNGLQLISYSAPVTPTGLTAASASPTQINLTWADVATDETGYLVERSTDGINFVAVTTVISNTTSYNDTGLMQATNYTYRIRLVRDLDTSSPSTVATARTGGVAAPTNLNVTRTGALEVDVSWTDVADNEVSWRVEASVTGSNVWSNGATVTVPNATSYRVTNLTPNTSYSLRLRLFDAAGNSNVSNVTSTTTANNLGDVYVDNADTSAVTVTGTWYTLTTRAYGVNSMHDGNGGKGTKSVRLTPTITTPGEYEVYAIFPGISNRAANVPYDVTSATGTSTVYIDQSQFANTWVLIGRYTFDAGTGGNVLVRTDGTTGLVTADAIRFVRVG